MNHQISLPFLVLLLSVLLGSPALPSASGQSFGSAARHTLQRVFAHAHVPTAPAAPPRAEASKPAFDTSELALAEDEVDFCRDWWKYTLMVLIFSIAAFLLVRVAKQIINLAIVLLCLGFSVLVAYVGGPFLGAVLKEVTPALDSPHFPALYWAYVICFICAYLIAILTFRLIRKPIADEGKKKD